MQLSPAVTPRASFSFEIDGPYAFKKPVDERVHHRFATENEHFFGHSVRSKIVLRYLRHDAANQTALCANGGLIS